MKKFLLVVLAVTVIVLSAVPAFAASYPLSNYPYFKSAISPFHTGNNNYLIPISSSSQLSSSYDHSYFLNLIVSGQYYIVFQFYNSSSFNVWLFNKSSYSYSSGVISVRASAPGFIFYFSYSSLSSSFNVTNSKQLSSGVSLDTKTSNYYVFSPNLTLTGTYWSFSDLKSFNLIDSGEYYPSLEHTLTVNYLYSQDNPAADPVTQELSSGEEYSIPSPQIEGYTPSIPLVTGTMPDEDLTIDVYYTKSFYPLTVKYQYQDGSKAADDVTQQYPFGFTYDIPSPEIEGHTPDKSSVSGIMPDGPLSEVVTYTPNSYNLRIDYLHLDGSQAAESYFQELPFGTKYAVPSPQLEGYYPNQSMITGTMRSHNVSYTVTYRPDSTGGSSGGGGADPDDSGGGDGSGGDGGGDYGGDDPFEGMDPPDFPGDDPFTGVNPPDFTGDDPFSDISSPEFSGFDPFKMPSSFDNVKTDFLAFSPAYLYEMVGNLRENIGAISSVAFYAFFVILGIYLIRNIIDNIIR